MQAGRHKEVNPLGRSWMALFWHSSIPLLKAMNFMGRGQKIEKKGKSSTWLIKQEAAGRGQLLESRYSEGARQ
jgi:hypothetical protein